MLRFGNMKPKQIIQSSIFGMACWLLWTSYVVLSPSKGKFFSGTAVVGFYGLHAGMLKPFWAYLLVLFEEKTFSTPVC